MSMVSEGGIEMECKCFKKETRFDFVYNTEKVKDYGEVGAVYGDHVYYRLLQCPKCGALFLYEEVEQIGWNDGNDVITDNFYQVESAEQADELVEEGRPMFTHKEKHWYV